MLGGASRVDGVVSGGTMSDDAPTLLVPSSELWQWAQALTTIGTLLARLRARRADSGRLAFADEEHAALQHEARQHPAARVMTSEEEAEWARRVPAVVREQSHGEPFSVWTARLADGTGRLTGEWGLEAHTWADGVSTSSARVVCRDAADVLALTRQLRANPTAETLRRVQALAVHASQLAPAPAAGSAPAGLGTTSDSVKTAATPVSEEDWAAMLRDQLPAEVAGRVIVTNPTHPHHRAWRELYALVCEEVTRVGADPQRLARLVATGPRWRAGVRNPPALAHWAITEARTSPTYATMISGAAAEVGSEQPRRPIRLAEVRSPHQALTWATDLRADNAEHLVEAKLGFGRWGSQVDAILGKTFPGLVTAAVPTAKRRPPSVVAGEPAANSTDDTVVPAPEPLDAVTVAGFVAEVDRLDPAKAIDRRAAHIMVGRVHPDVDHRIATVFADDPQIMAKVQSLYPAGLPAPAPDLDAEAAHRSLAHQHEAAAATADAALDEPNAATADRASVVAATERGLADRHHQLAAAAAQTQPRPGRSR